MVCTLQRKHDERYENKRKEALARISSLVQTRAGFGILQKLWHFTEEELRAAGLERRRCKTLERKIAEVEEIIEARETLTWLTEASPSMQKSAIEEDSDHLVTLLTIWRRRLQPNEEGEQEVYEIENLPKEMWELGEDPDSDDDGLDPQIGHFALRGQLEIPESECPRGGTHEGGRPGVGHLRSFPP